MSTNSADMTKQPLPDDVQDQEQQSKKRKIDSSVSVDDDDDAGVATITEGSATMSYPADQESSVFYNPVQVQNRDLSTLMITLYAERRAKRQAVQRKKKQLNQKHKAENKKKGDDGNNKIPKDSFKVIKQQIKEQVEEYEATLDGRDLVQNEQNASENGITILDALAASGLRSIRYWKEIPGVKHVTINDLELAAIDRANDNIRRNQIPSEFVLDNTIDRSHGICVHHGDAMHEMYMSRMAGTKPPGKSSSPLSTRNQQPMWDVIDLDPYGSAAPFIDGAVQAVENGGLLCVTCTDMPALGGAHPETAFGRYACLPIQSAQYLQEVALRILLYTLAVSAARYGRTIKPILCVGMDFYIRCFVEVYNDKKGVGDLSLRIGHVYQSTQCSTFVTLPHGQLGGKKSNVYQSIRLTPPACPETDSPWKVGGPLWLGPLHDQDVVRDALQRLSDPDCTAPDMKFLATRKRLLGLLTSVSEELDVPLYYSLPDICKKLHCSSPPLKQFKAGIINAGYKCSGYHKDPSAIKTDAPHNIIWDIMRVWIRDHHPLKKPSPEGSVAQKILAVEPTTAIDFALPSTLNTSSGSVSRFPQNPQTHWGPKRKASGKQATKSDEEKNSTDT